MDVINICLELGKMTSKQKCIGLAYGPWQCFKCPGRCFAVSNVHILITKFTAGDAVDSLLFIGLVASRYTDRLTCGCMR